MTAPEKDEVREDQVVEETEAAGLLPLKQKILKQQSRHLKGTIPKTKRKIPLKLQRKRLQLGKISIFAFMRNGIRIVVA